MQHLPPASTAAAALAIGVARRAEFLPMASTPVPVSPGFRAALPGGYELQGQARDVLRQLGDSLVEESPRFHGKLPRPTRAGSNDKKIKGLLPHTAYLKRLKDGKHPAASTKGGNAEERHRKFLSKMVKNVSNLKNS